MNYDVLIIGAGPGGIFSAYELIQQDPNLRVGVFEAGHALGGRKCPIDGNKIKSCIGCKKCIREIGCPAIVVKDGQVTIEEGLCTGCGLCSQICPVHAIGGACHE